jgi:hypothetical protein
LAYFDMPTLSPGTSTPQAPAVIPAPSDATTPLRAHPQRRGTPCATPSKASTATPDPDCEALAAAGRRRVRGIAAQSLFTALLLVAANIRKTRAWRALTADGRTGTTRRARRRRASLRDHLPDG